MFIQEYHNNLGTDFCKHVIEKFEKDPRKVQGRIGMGVDLTVKQSMDLNISRYDDYKEEDKIFYDALSPILCEYMFERMKKTNHVVKSMTDSGYQIQKTVPDGFYTWHDDFGVEYKKTKVRIITYLWYLNTIKEGGETEFITGEKIKPEAGKLLLFPATWTFGHQGLPPKKKSKYVCTGWVYNDIVSYN